MFNSMVALHQHFKLQMKPQVVYGSDISLPKVTSLNIFVSADMAPDVSAVLDPFQGIY